LYLQGHHAFDIEGNPPSWRDSWRRSPPNLCSTVSGEAFIIDFSHAEMSTSRDTRAFEISKICRLLNIDENQGRSKPAFGKEMNVAGLRWSARIKKMKEVEAAVALLWYLDADAFIQFFLFGPAELFLLSRCLFLSIRRFLAARPSH
jgi:hypothetical protein